MLLIIQHPKTSVFAPFLFKPGVENFAGEGGGGDKISYVMKK